MVWRAGGVAGRRRPRRSRHAAGTAPQAEDAHLVAGRGWHSRKAGGGSNRHFPARTAEGCSRPALGPAARHNVTWRRFQGINSCSTRHPKQGPARQTAARGHLVGGHATGTAQQATSGRHGLAGHRRSMNICSLPEGLVATSCAQIDAQTALTGRRHTPPHGQGAGTAQRAGGSQCGPPGRRPAWPGGRSANTAWQEGGRQDPAASKHSHKGLFGHDVNGGTTRCPIYIPQVKN